MNFLTFFFILFFLFVATRDFFSQQIFPETIYRNSQSCILSVYMYDSDSTFAGSGSAVVVSADGLVYSVFHLLRNASFFKIYKEDSLINDVRIVSIDPFRDILILKIPPQTNFIRRGNSDSIEIGETVYSIGNPMNLKKTFASGLISGIRNEFDNRNLQYSASISSGSSGGALLNSRGEIIGVTASSYFSSQNLNFAVPVNQFYELEIPQESDTLYFKLISELSKYYSESENPVNPENILKMYRETQSHNLTLTKCVARLCAKEGNHDSAVSLYSEAIRLFPYDKELYFWRAISNMKTDEIEKVEEDFSRVLELDSKYSDVYLYRSLFYQFYNKNTELEITNYNKLLELKPDYKFILYERALAYLSVGDTQKALKDLVNLSGSRIDDAVICSLRGTIYRNLGNYSYSIREFSKAIQMSEENAEYYFERGGVYAYLDDYESATSDYLKCMEKKPAWKDLYYHLGDSYYHIGDYDQAEMFFLKALKHGSNDFITYVGLSVLFYNKNEIVKMKRFMYHAMKLHRELESGMKGLEKLEKKGYYWSSRKKSDLYKVFEAMGIKEKEREDAKKTKRKHKTKPYPGKQQ